uniref:Uncharacterized protein n=1 Tax=Ornithodoros turicata TaxID=34597 RepID=A0A2R5LIZ4_9ACAR
MKSVEEVLGVSDINTRALICYNFVAQDVFTVDESKVVAWCIAQDKLLLATSRPCIEVRDLDAKGQLSLTFPTVARVAMMDYCERGNYIVTLENAEESPVVRLYLNWWVNISKQVLDLRKIGSPPQGIVAPNCLQVVEFVGTTRATCIACCSRSGAVAVAESDVVRIFCPKTCTGDLGKKYEDFYLLVSLKLPAAPVRVFLIEDHFAYYTSSEVHVVKLCFECDACPLEVPADDSNRPKQENIFDNVDCGNVTNDTHFVEWTFGAEDASHDSTGCDEDKLKGVLHSASFPATLTLRSESFRAIIDLTALSEKTILGPKRSTPDLKIIATLSQDIEPSFVLSNVTVITMLYRRFAPSNDGEGIRAFQWVPYYSKVDKIDSTDPLTEAMSQREIALSSVLHSSYHGSLQSLSCFVSSTDEGYLYDLTTSATLLSAYKYSSPLKSAVLDECFLHAFTNRGLETYILHTPSRVLPSNLPLNERSPVLVGLRPFLGISTIVMSDSHLVLHSSSEDPTEQLSTVYSLLKPTVCQFCNDLREAATVYKSEEEKTKFVEMLSDALVVVSTSILLRGTTPCSSEIRKVRSDLCCLLGDVRMKEEKCTSEAAAYYIHSEQPPEAVLGRILSFRGQLPNHHVTKAIVAFLKFEMCRALPASETSSGLGSENVAENVLETVAEECPDLLHKLVLRCRTPIFRTEKSVNVLRRKLTNKRQSPIYAANTIAVSYLLRKTGNEEAAQNILKALQKESLVLVLLDMHDLIHDGQDITDLGRLIKASRPDAYLSMLAHLKFNGTLSAEQAVFLLQHSCPERELHCVPLLKEFLEAVLSSKRTNAAACAHLLTMLIKIYIGRMAPDDKSPQRTLSNVHSKPASLFGSRAPWIKELPPFNGSSVTKSCSLYATSVNLSECCLCWNCWDDLLRLQSLLGSSLPSESVKAAALETLTNTGLLESENYVSLKVLCLAPGDAISILVEDYPTAVLGFMQDKFPDDTSQWLWLYKAVETKQGVSQNRDASKAYMRVMHGVLGHLSNVLSPGEFVELLPCGKPEYMEYVTHCTECYQAKILREKIICLGTELKEMM